MPEIVPRLLVSVRNVAEARAALEGGCDVVDIKEPKRGSLGMGDVETIRAIGEIVQTSGKAELSAALGEAVDWIEADGVPALPSHLAYLKTGLATMQDMHQWEEHWRDLRGRFDKAGGKKFGWVAVAYADWQRAMSPDPIDVIAAAGSLHCPVLLLDTQIKDGRSLLDWLGVEELGRLRERVTRHGMQFALAGSLNQSHLPALKPLEPHIIAVRSAGCLGGDRTGQIDANAVQKFKAELLRAFA